MRNIKLSVEKNQAELLVLLYFFLQPWGNTFLIPLAIMCVLGSLMVMKWKRLNADDQTVIKKILLLAACLWLPIVISLPDAIAFKRTLSTTLTYPLYVLSGLYLAVSFTRNFNRELFLKFMLPMILIWGIASFIQMMFFDDGSGRIQGIFKEKLTLGIILGSLTPLIILLLGKTNRKTTYLLTFMLLAIFISGTRSAWLTGTIFFVIYYFLFLKDSSLRFKLSLLTFYCLALILIINNSSIGQRISQTSQALSADQKNINEATGGRLELWKDAFNLGLKHPITGVGANNFRYGQIEVVADKDSLWTREIPEDGFTIIGFAHTHQIILEAWSNTGLVGLIGIIIFYLAIFKQTFLSWHEKDLLALAGLLALLAAIFPLGSHNNLYGSWMTGWIWVLTGISFGLAASSKNRSLYRT